MYLQHLQFIRKCQTKLYQLTQKTNTLLQTVAVITDTFRTLQHNYKVYLFQKGGKRYYIHKCKKYKCNVIQNYQYNCLLRVP